MPRLQDGLDVQLGNGDGSFQSVVHYATASNVSLVVSDFNRDGKLDVATTGSGVDGTSINCASALGVEPPDRAAC